MELVKESTNHPTQIVERNKAEKTLLDDFDSQIAALTPLQGVNNQLKERANRFT